MTSRRLKLINCDEKILKLILEGDKYLSKGLNLVIPKKWTEFGESIFKYSLEKVKNNPGSGIWWTYLPVLIESNTLIGSCGFKGEPNNEGIVEIGYEVVEEFRNEGFATEITNLLIRIAFKDNKVTVIHAHTLAEKNASIRVLKKCNFEFVEEIEEEEEDGTIWKWKLKK